MPASIPLALPRIPVVVLCLVMLPACPALVSDDYEQVASDAAGSTDPAGGGGAPGPAGPTCSDGEKNGDESDVDCGTACERKCALGQACKGGGDCDRDTRCDKGVCKAK